MTPRPAISSAALTCALVILTAPAGARAWGAMGHRLIGQLAVEALPPGLPAFLGAPETAATVGELAREPDRSKQSGRAHDSDRDPGHFLDLDDQGRVLGGPALTNLPETRAAYDTALRQVGADSWKAGYLPYSIVEDWQQLAKDFAYWRIEKAAATTVANPAHRAWFESDLVERQALILRDLGALAHFVGDGSQPLHVTVHFNGWGDFPDPKGYTQARIHGPFEGAFVYAYADPKIIAADMTPHAGLHGSIMTWTEAYLGRTHDQVVPFYTLEKAGGFVNGDARGRAFVDARLADGASALRDLIVDAWRVSAGGQAGWPSVTLPQVEAGMDPYDSLYGVD